MNLSTNGKHGIAALLLVLVSLPIIMLAGSVVSSSYTTLDPIYEIGGTPAILSPVKVNSYYYDVRDGDSSTLIQRVYPGTSAVGYFNSADKRYPDVEIKYSQPFFTTPSGDYIDASTLSLTPVQKLVLGSNIYYYQEFYIAQDVAARTYTNLPTYTSNVINLSPFYGVTHTDPGDKTNTLTEAAAIGSLILYCDTGDNWYREYHGTGSAITTSLVPMTWRGLTAAYDFDSGLGAAIGRVQTEFGNSQVIVQPTITAGALDNFITYDYTREVIMENGSIATVQVKTSSARVGFLNAYNTFNDRYGLVSNIAAVYNERVNMETTSTTGALDNAPANDAELATASAQGFTLTSHVQYLGDSYVPPVTGGARCNSYTSSLTTTPTINLTSLVQTGTWTLPTTMNHNLEFTLQPKTDVKVARTDVEWSHLWYCYWWPGDENQVKTETRVIEYPYGVTVENIYAITRVVTKIALVTENAAQVVAVDGKPIAATDIVDFDFTGTIELDPGIDDVDDNVTIPVWDPVAAWNDFWSGASWNDFWMNVLLGNPSSIMALVVTLAVIGVVAMIILGVLSRSPLGRLFGLGGGSGGSSGGRRSWELRVGKGGVRMKSTKG